MSDSPKADPREADTTEDYPMEVVFSFDTSGSMYSCFIAFRYAAQELFERLFEDIPSLKVSLIVHGDYSSGKMFYTTKHVDFTNDVKALCKFAKKTGGSRREGNTDCYEVVLQKVRTEFKWTPDARKVLVMIGDAAPHEFNHPKNTTKIDWPEEVQKLHEEVGVKIYGVQFMEECRSRSFFRHIATQTGGKHLQLDQYSSIANVLTAICYKEQGNGCLEAYEKEVLEREGDDINEGVIKLFDNLRDTPSQPTKQTDTSMPSPETSNKRSLPITESPKSLSVHAIVTQEEEQLSSAKRRKK